MSWLKKKEEKKRKERKRKTRKEKRTLSKLNYDIVKIRQHLQLFERSNMDENKLNQTTKVVHLRIQS